MPYYQTTGLSYCSPPAYTSQTILTGLGIFKPLMVCKRHDTDGRRRQLTKLPRPYPQYPPFTLRYGNAFWFSLSGGSWRFRHHQCRLQPLRITTRAFDAILLTGKHRFKPWLSPQAVIASASVALADFTAPHSGRNLNTESYEQVLPLLFVNEQPHPVHRFCSMLPLYQAADKKQNYNGSFQEPF